MSTWVHTVIRAGLVVGLSMLLVNCGAWQSIRETSSDAAHAIFITKVKEMNLLIEGRAELNRDDRDVSLPVVLRVYQLRDPHAFEAGAYAQLLDDTGSIFKADALKRSDLVLSPGSTATLGSPMADDARYVGVIALFRSPVGTHWRLVIPRDQWKKTDPVKISVIDNRLVLEP